jgi:branched-chain amino acid transport system substrate-binding protein
MTRITGDSCKGRRSSAGARLTLLSACAGLSLLLAACGGDVAPTASPAPVAPPATAATGAATAAATVATVGDTPTGAAEPATPAAGGAAGGTILFGAPLGITGSLSNESKLTQQGYELWKETVNAAGGIKVGGKQYMIATKYYDDQSKQDLSGQLTEKLINEDKVNFLLGPYGTSATQSDAAIAEKYEIPMVEGEGAAEKIFSQGYKYTFGTLSPAQFYLKGVVEMAAAQNPKPKTVVILSANDSFSVEVADGAKKVAEGLGLTVAAYIKYPDKETNLTAQVTQAKALNPDLLLNSGHFAEAVAIVKAAKELGLNTAGAGFSVGPSLPDFQTSLKADADYVYGGAQWTKDLKLTGDDPWKTPQAYYDAFVKRWGNAPSYQSAMATACGLVFQRAIEKAGTLDTKQVRDAIAATDFTSFAGHMKFDDRGINTFKPMAVEQWQKGAKQTVWPADVASAPPMWPAPAWDKR